MTTADFEFHSPLTLLNQWCKRLDQAPLRELLVTGYTLDLAFFEHFCVPKARGAGARVTVVSDANHPVHEPVDVRHAGRSYQHGNAHCQGAFHPKLALLVGDDEIWVAIGSGNPTTAGWGHNAELWLVVRSPRHTGPAAMHDLAHWLHTLPSTVHMPGWIADTLTELAAMIAPAHTDDTFSELRIFGNLHTPLLDQIPAAIVEELRLSAPFHDPEAAAVHALIDRLAPDKLTIALQPAVTVFNGANLAAAATAVPRTEFRFIADGDRVHHGKLIEWETPAGGTAMVGSANLSRAALMTSTRDGGNCELAVAYPTMRSLLPEGTPTPLQRVRTLDTTTRYERRPEPNPITLLGARRAGALITVEFVARKAGTVSIDASPTGAPATWETVHTLHSTGGGADTANFSLPHTGLAAGAVLRARIEHLGHQYISTSVFLTDPARCLPRSHDQARPRLARDYPLGDLFADPALADKFANDLTQLINQLHQTGHTAAAAPPATALSQARSSDDRWGDWVRETEHSLGSSLASHILPGLAAFDSEATPVQAVAWSLDASESADITDDEDAEDIDPLGMDHPAHDTATINPLHHPRYRKWAAKLRRIVTNDPRPPLEFRILATMLYLDMLAAGLWARDPSWRTDFAPVVEALTPSDEEIARLPGPATAKAANLAAVALTVLRQDTRLHGGRSEDLLIQAVWRTVAPFAALADKQQIENFIIESSQAYGRTTTEYEVSETIDHALEVDDPHAATSIALKSESIDASFRNGVWEAAVQRKPTRRLAAHIATVAGCPCAVAVNGGHETIAILRDRGTVALAETRSKFWRIFPVTELSSPLSLLAGPDGLPRRYDRCFPHQPNTQLTSLAKTVGIDLDRLQRTIWTSP